MKKTVLLAIAGVICQLSASTLTLEQCYKQALANNLSLKISEIQKYTAETNRHGALYKFYDLTGEYNGGYAYSKDQPDNDPLAAGQTKNELLTSSKLTSSIGLTFNAKLNLGLIDNYKLKKLAVSSSDLSANQNRLDLLKDVTEKFYNLASAKEELDMKREKIELSRLQYEQEKLKLQLGNSTKSELYAAEVEYSADSLAIFTAETTVNQNKQSLISTINSNESYYSFDISVDKTDLEKYEPVTGGLDLLIKEALDSRADYQAEKNSLAMEQLNLDMARHKYLPSALASAGAGYALENDLEDDAMKRNFGYKATLGLSWSVDFLSDCNNVELSKLSYEQKKLELENTANQISLTVKNSYLLVKMQEQQLLQTRKHLELTKQNLELAEEMYRLGKKSLIEIVSAKNNYITAKQGNIDARYKYKIAYSELMNVIGR